MKLSKERILKVLFLFYIVILFRITVFRSGFSLSHLMQNGTINLTLFQYYIPLLKQGRWLQFIYLFVGNIIWFVPLGCGLMTTKKVTHVYTAVLCGLFLSLLIETMQFIFGTGVSELDDLILNSLGTWAGAAAVQMWKHLCKKAAESP